MADDAVVEPVEDSTPTGESGSTEAQPSYEELQAELSAMKEQSQKYSTALHTATKRIDKLEKVARAVPEINEQLESKQKPEPKRNSEVDRSLLERIEKIEAREAAAKQRDRVAAIRGALEENGLDANRARRFAHVIDREQNERLAVDDEGIVTIQDGETVSGVNDWMRAYLQTEEGRVFLPPKKMTSTKVASDSGSGSGTKKVSAAEYGRLTIEQIQSGQYEIG